MARKLIVISMLAVGCGGEPFASGFNTSPGLETDGGSAGGAATVEPGDSGAGGKIGHAHGGAGSGGASSGGVSSGGAPDSTGGSLGETGGVQGSGGETGGTGGAGSGGDQQGKGGGDACAPTTHDNGLGGTWQDCVPLDTHNLAQAMKACSVAGATQCYARVGCSVGILDTVRGYDATGQIVGEWGYDNEGAGYATGSIGGNLRGNVCLGASNPNNTPWG